MEISDYQQILTEACPQPQYPTLEMLIFYQELQHTMSLMPDPLLSSPYGGLPMVSLSVNPVPTYDYDPYFYGPQLPALTPSPSPLELLEVQLQQFAPGSQNWNFLHPYFPQQLAHAQAPGVPVYTSFLDENADASNGEGNLNQMLIATASNNNANQFHQNKTQGSRNRKPKSPRDKKVFTCPTCNRSFGYKHVLQNHEMRHTGERPFECTICTKRFRRKHHLIVHIRMHTGEKPYHCVICDRRFIQSGVLKYHLERVHTKVRSYTQQQGSTRFFDSKHVRAEMLTVSNEASASPPQPTVNNDGEKDRDAGMGGSGSSSSGNSNYKSKRQRKSNVIRQIIRLDTLFYPEAFASNLLTFPSVEDPHDIEGRKGSLPVPVIPTNSSFGWGVQLNF